DRNDVVLEEKLERGKIRIAPEILLPVAVANEGHRGGSEALVSRREAAPDDRLDAKNGEEVLRNCGDHGAGGLLAPGNRLQIGTVLGDTFEGTILRAEVGEIGVGEIHAVAGRRAFPDADNPIGMVEGKRTQQNTVNDAEDSRGGGDAQAESRDRDR